MARRSKPKAYLLDTWAIMAYLEDEPAGKAVEALIVEAHEAEVPLLMSVANVAEVWYTFAREATADEANQALAELRQLGIEFWDVTLDLALQAAKFKAQHKMSLADCFAAALAVQQKAELVTGDREFKQVEGHVKILWIDLVQAIAWVPPKRRRYKCQPRSISRLSRPAKLATNSALTGAASTSNRSAWV